MPQQAQPPVAVISGGSSGIGLEIARALKAQGYWLHLIARDPLRLEQARAALGPEGVAVHALDVAEEAGCAQVIETVLAQHGRIDWLVCSAGIAEPGFFLDLPAASHRRQMEVNYFGTLNLVHPVARAMRAAGTGRITLISSAVAFGGIVGYSAYTPGKFAVHALGETLAIELQPYGIAVSVAFPPDTDTPQLAAESLLRPEATRRIAQGGGVLPAAVVAQSIVQGAQKGHFMLVPSPLMRAYGWFHSLISPVLRLRQARILAQSLRKQP